MALQDALHAFALAHPAVGDIFYTTTPPRIATEMLRAGGLEIGNFRLGVTPRVMISPRRVGAAGGGWLYEIISPIHEQSGVCVVAA